MAIAVTSGRILCSSLIGAIESRSTFGIIIMSTPAATARSTASQQPAASAPELWNALS